MKYASVTALTLFLVAGTAAVAQESKNRPRENAGQQQQQKQPDRPGDAQDRRSLENTAENTDFRSADALQGRDIINHGGEDIGEVSELLINRGSGRIDYAVVKTGAVLGMGGKTIAIPYGALRWNQTNDKFVLDATEDQLKRYPEFSAARWNAQDPEERAEEQREARERQREQARERAEERAEERDDRDEDFRRFDRSDPYAGSFDAANRVRIEGEIVSVDRDQMGSDDETIIKVKTADGSVRRVSLGPSWFVSGGGYSPSRGDRVVIESFSVRGKDDLYTAASVQSDGRSTKYRDTEHKPSWAARDMKSGDRAYGASQWRYVMADDLKGMKVDCRGAECGTVDSVIVERGSGRVAFLAVDPDENFLGMGDTKRLVPWAVASVSLDKKVRLDADKDMILAAPEAPSDAGMLSSGTKAAMVYRAFKVERPDFERRERASLNVPARGDDRGLWGGEGQIAKAIESAPTQTLTGTVQGVKTVECGKTGQTAKAITLRTSDNREETVVLGPAWYVDAQPTMEYESGDKVKLEVCKVNLDGKSYWITKSLEHDGRRTAMWEDDGPIWDR